MLFNNTIGSTDSSSAQRIRAAGSRAVFVDSATGFANKDATFTTIIHHSQIKSWKRFVGIMFNYYIAFEQFFRMHPRAFSEAEEIIRGEGKVQQSAALSETRYPFVTWKRKSGAQCNPGRVFRKLGGLQSVSTLFVSTLLQKSCRNKQETEECILKLSGYLYRQGTYTQQAGTEKSAGVFTVNRCYFCWTPPYPDKSIRDLTGISTFRNQFFLAAAYGENILIPRISTAWRRRVPISSAVGWQ